MSVKPHTMPWPATVDVAVVGAGPAGLAAACTLRKAGVNVVVLDAALKPSNASRATVIHSRTLEVLESLGLTNAVLAQGDVLTTWNICSGSWVLANLDFTTLQARYPMVVTLPQSATEKIFRDEVEALGGQVIYGTTVKGVKDDWDVVQLELAMTDTPICRGRMTAAYVVAADGLKSTIRASLNVGFESGEYTASFITADCRFRSRTLRKDAVQLFLAPSGFVLFVPEPHEIWRIVATVDQAPGEADVELYQRLVDQRTVPGIKVEELP